MPLLLSAHHRQQRVQPLSNHALRLAALLLLRDHGVHVSHKVRQTLRAFWAVDRRARFAFRRRVGAGDGCQAVVESNELLRAVVDKLLQPCIELIQVCAGSADDRESRGELDVSTVRNAYIEQCRSFAGSAARERP